MDQHLAKLYHTLSKKETEWFDQKLESIKVSSDDKDLFFSFSIVQRKIERKKIFIDQKKWYTDELVRIFFLLGKESNDADSFYQIFEKLFITSDAKESMALLKGLPFYPYSVGLLNKASEGLRSNVIGIFQAVSIQNSFGSQYFNEMTWNQMILKSLFIESPLYLVTDIDEKCNIDLNRMLCDYALERIAASRNIIPELWRCVTNVSDNRIFNEWEMIWTNGNEIEKSAVGLISNRLKDQIDPASNILASIELEKLVYNTWDAIGEALENEKEKL